MDSPSFLLLATVSFPTAYCIKYRIIPSCSGGEGLLWKLSDTFQTALTRQLVLGTATEVEMAPRLRPAGADLFGADADRGSDFKLETLKIIGSVGAGGHVEPWFISVEPKHIWVSIRLAESTLHLRALREILFSSQALRR